MWMQQSDKLEVESWNFATQVKTSREWWIQLFEALSRILIFVQLIGQLLDLAVLKSSLNMLFDKLATYWFL